MRYDLNCEIDICRFKHRVASLISRRCIVELTDKKPVRTSSQNKYLHCILGEFAMQTGNPIGYVKQEYFKRLCNPELFVRVEYGSPITEPIYCCCHLSCIKVTT